MKRVWNIFGVLVLIAAYSFLAVFVANSRIWLEEVLGIEHKPDFYIIKYEVDYGFITENGSFITFEGVADITYINENGGTSHETKASLSWSKVFTAQRGAVLYISAQNVERSASEVLAVRIYVNGFEVKHSDSSGEYAVATASGVL